jgi:hypothetical protein
VKTSRPPFDVAQDKRLSISIAMSDTIREPFGAILIVSIQKRIHREGTESSKLEKFEHRNSNFEILLCGLCVSLVKMTSENRFFFLWLRQRRARKM